jgi:hypothetical protein
LAANVKPAATVGTGSCWLVAAGAGLLAAISLGGGWVGRLRTTVVFGRAATSTPAEKEATRLIILVYKYLTHVPDDQMTFVLVAVHTRL